MKNSAFDQPGIKSFVRRSISVLLVFATLAFGDVAKAADSKIVHSDDAVNGQLVNTSNQGDYRKSL